MKQQNSAKPLAEKLGIKQGAQIYLKNAPEKFIKRIGKLPAGASVVKRLKKNIDCIHIFADELKTLEEDITKLRPYMHDEGVFWISWPKSGAHSHSDITEDKIRALAHANRLVDVKVVAVDDEWSGLKLVVPLRDRATTKNTESTMGKNTVN